MTADELLQELLSGKNPKLAPLQKELESSRIKFVGKTTSIGRELFDIYSKRAAINKRSGGQAHGYEDLLPNLKSSGEQSVTVLGVNTEKLSFLVFTTETRHDVLGMLWGYSPYRNAVV